MKSGALGRMSSSCSTSGMLFFYLATTIHFLNKRTIAVTLKNWISKYLNFLKDSHNYYMLLLGDLLPIHAQNYIFLSVTGFLVTNGNETYDLSH
jgi:hypothetical protein